MTQFQKGDTVKYAHKEFDVVTAGTSTDGGDWLLIDATDGKHTPLLVKAHHVEKVEPFFVVGKEYTCFGDTFEVLRVDEGTNGKTAYGKFTGGITGNTAYVIKRRDVFKLWEKA